MKKRILVLLALLLTVQSMTACAGEKAPEETSPTADAANAEAASEAEETEAEEVTEEDLFPKLEHTTTFTDYGGYDFGILTREAEVYRLEMDSDEMTGEAVNDAIVTRNLTLEEQFNIKIFANGVGGGHGPDGIENLVMSGDTTIDMIVGSCYGMMPKTVNGYFQNLNVLENLNLDQICWSQGIRDCRKELRCVR